jgi:hypothetical protein
LVFEAEAAEGELILVDTTKQFHFCNGKEQYRPRLAERRWEGSGSMFATAVRLVIRQYEFDRDGSPPTNFELRTAKHTQRKIWMDEYKT